jgi:hypothetical protein
MKTKGVMMKARPYPAWITKTFIFAMTALAATGMLQMPLAKRYFVSEIPGLAWTADFFIVHKLHYIFAALLLFVVALVAVHWLLDWRKRLTLSALGVARVSILCGLIFSGGMRVYRGLPDVTLNPDIVVAIEWLHLTLSMVMGVVALVALIMKQSAYTRRR